MLAYWNQTNNVKKNSTNPYTCSTHTKIIHFLKSAVELNACSRFSSFPRCLRGTESSSMETCRFHTENSFHENYFYDLNEVDFSKELAYRCIYKDDNFQQALQDATLKLEKIAAVDFNVKFYIGASVGNGENRHAGNRELPLGSIIKNLVHLPCKAAAQSFEASLINLILSEKSRQ